MGYYDVFSRFYDGAVADLYQPYRELARERLDLTTGMTVLDVGCGTGLSFDVLAPSVGPTGRIVGVDRSSGMLHRAAQRIEQRGWEHVDLVECDVQQLDRTDLEAHIAKHGEFDRALFFLVLSALPAWDETFERVWSVLRPGARVVIIDAHAERLGFQGWMVNLTARADIRRVVWKALEKRAEAFHCERFARRQTHRWRYRCCHGTEAG